MQNTNLNSAKKARNDEFYTQYADIEREVEAYLEYDPDVFRGRTVLLPCDDPERSNFTKFFLDRFDELGIRKLVSTCIDPQALSKLPLFDGIRHGRYLIRTSDGETSRGALEDTGDFRSREISELRDACDIIVTNPPFSLFREFVRWITDAQKKFLIIGNMNAITYKEIFPLIKEGGMWTGATGFMTDMVFAVPAGTKIREDDRLKAAKIGYVGNYTRLGNSCWFTNLEHGKRHEPLKLHTMDWTVNTASTRKSGMYRKYDNYDAIDVPYVDAIPSDYEGVMGVPISFLGKYCPEQFEILDVTRYSDSPYKTKRYSVEQYENANDLNACSTIMVNGKLKITYKRILIRHKHPEK